MTQSASPLPGATYVKAPERSSIGDDAPVETLVSEIIANVRKNGDAAVREYSARFDSPTSPYTKSPPRNAGRHWRSLIPSGR